MCTSITTHKHPDVSTNFYANGSIVQIKKDEHGRVSTSNFFNRDHQLLMNQSIEYAQNGDVDHVTQTYTDAVEDDKLKNRMIVILDSADATRDKSYDRLQYKYVSAADYNPEIMSRKQTIELEDGSTKEIDRNIEIKDDNGNVIGYYVYEHMRIPETVPIIYNDGISEVQTVGARPITSMTVDYEGYITQLALFKGLDNGFNRFEHCSTAEFDKRNKLVGMSTLVNKLTSPINVEHR